MSQAEWSTSSSEPGRLGRRAALAGLLGLTGCGFRPLYGPVSALDGGTGDIRAELAAVRVGPIFERQGQLLRRNLLRKFEDSAPGTPGRYLLQVWVSSGVEVLGYRRDGTITRVRYTASGNWNLTTMGTPPQTIAASAIPYRTLDSFNIPDLQFFAADSARDAMEARVADDLAEEIFRRVAVELRRRKESGAAA
ncbi:LPS assembly lipoprotein LptE [Siccirubricoccus sp. KC 17139]|uniref:LPS assembly lipoprotein LptE n=1 Tax=Siccirubricoccus soli TaxID=2899147 RepID=A0ABT1D046_9PROT|nr:LPS assembly lipoprotein LptE [Siccirubricoccus soli]MCO6415291.1 LPS assembly lipoprotein LptE [Siccirubricoccus soli]MCP2681422.1 LPS assembly lipoprotein LptE [Siccirubricoccus soli]